MRFLWLILLCSLSFAQLNNNKCPEKCLCFSTTVRCMFLQLQQIPRIPSETTILDLRFNRIRQIPPNTFSNLRNLNTLLLNNNHVKKLQNGAFNGLENLKFLYLYKNRIRVIEKNVFRNMGHLEQLYLHYNDLGTFQRETFFDLTSLERLFLHNNRLHSIPLGAFANLHSLKRLRLDSNALVCDCQILWLAKMVQQKQDRTQVAATCEYPTGLQGKSLTSLTDMEFDCKGHPEILEDPTDVEVSFGGTASFACKADGDPTPEVVWYHNNEILPDDTRYSVLRDGTLRIKGAKKKDMGFFECLAKNKMGEVMSKKAQIVMADESTQNEGGKPQMTQLPSDTKVREGSSLTLKCKAVGNPEPHITWSKDGRSVEDDIRRKISTEGYLIIAETVREDAGKYSCQAANHLGRVVGVAQVIILVEPIITEAPEDQYSKPGGTAVFACKADGEPTPVLTWLKGSSVITPTGRYNIFVGGHHLRIQDVAASDEGEIVCRAENDAGVAEKKAQLLIRNHVAPVINKKPLDVSIFVGSDATIQCNAQGIPTPRIAWRKNRIPIPTNDKYSIQPEGSLKIINVTMDDDGTYECTARNSFGIDSATAILNVKEKPVKYIGDEFLTKSFEEAQQRVNLAVNDTISMLFNRTRTSPPRGFELLQIFRFPQSQARDLARAAETIEQTLDIVYRHVEHGHRFNLTDFSYDDLLSPQKLRILTDLSGCLIHNKPVKSCDDLCYHKKYRNLDGSCNNLNNPMWGTALSAFRRSLKPIYENGFNTPIGWSKTKTYYGFPKPSTRLVSTRVLSNQHVTPDPHCTHMIMQWGQFLDHDLDHALPAVSTESFKTGIPCQRSCDNSPPCFPIDVPFGDHRVNTHRCIEFTRSSPICGSGVTSVFFNKVVPREQINQLTSYIDASQVYSSSEPELQALRDRTGRRGQLRRGLLTKSGRYLLPFSNGAPIDCRRNHSESAIDCFLGGDVRANEQVGLVSMHTIFFREHNRIAEELEQINPHWDSDTIFHETRKIIGAFSQHITYTYWLPHIIGPSGMEQLGNFTKYDPLVDATISNVFATAAFRFGHSLINPVMERLNSSFQPIPEGPLHLHQAFFSPWRVVEEGGIDPILRGLFTSPAKKKMPGESMNSELTEKLFRAAHEIALDLGAINIQRGRDHALPGYLEWRKHCGLSVPKTFEELSQDISSPSVLFELRRLYGHPGNMDLFVGGMMEDPIEGGRVGKTFSCIIIDQFRRLRDGDRFWYQNPWVFKPEQLRQIEQVTLGGLLCNNGDNITDVTKDVFVLPNLQNPAFIPCSDVPLVDLRMWAECCTDCRNAGFFSSLSHPSGRRFRRDLEYSLKEDREDYINSINPKLSNANVTYHHVLTTDTSKTAIMPEKLNRQKPIEDIFSFEYEPDINEERIEGLESLVEQLTKTLNSLNKKVKQLERHHQPKFNKKFLRKRGCQDENGVHRKRGAVWLKDRCSKCTCRLKGVKCRVRTCSKHCMNPILTENSCCPKCNNDQITQ